MHSLCAEQKMEEVFEGITVFHLVKMAAELGKDEILRVCNCEQV